MTNSTLPLGELRKEIDAIDDAIHDLLLQRAEVVRRVGAVKGVGQVALRPAREAMILRRLAAKHRGELPVPVILRMWRELISGLTQLQGRFGVVVFAPDEQKRGFWDVARDHFGSFAPMTAAKTPVAVVRAVSEGTASVGVVPFPFEDDKDPWWRFINGDDPKMPRVVARLPFFGRGNGRGEDRDALVIAMVPHEASADDRSQSQLDRSLVRIELGEDVSRARLKETLDASGLPVINFSSWLSRPGSAPVHLVEVAGFVGPGDARLGTCAERLAPVPVRLNTLGGYAVPLALR